MSDLDNLAVLRRMYDEGRITDDEYANLTGGLDSPAARQALQDDPSEAPDLAETELPEVEAAAPDAEERPLLPLPPRLKKNISPNYLGGLGLASMLLIAASALEMLPWTVTIVGVLVLLTTLIDGWGVASLVGGGLFGVLLVATLLLSAFDEPAVETVVANSAPSVTTPEPIPGSLGIYMDQVTELWNTVDGPPRITKGLVRNNEIGEYDTFIYRFGGGLSVAGAFDPDDEAVYALLVNGAFTDKATDQLYLHVCFIVAPYSQECIDAYREQGLDGGTLEDFTDMAHEAEWQLGENTWRLEIAQNLLAIRVYGPDTA